MTDTTDDIEETPTFQLSWKLIPILLITGLIVYMLVGHLADVERFVATLAGARWEWFAGCLALSAAIVSCNGWRFQVVLKAVGYDISVRRAIQVVLTVWPLVLLIPARANDLVRAAVLHQEVPPSSCIGSVIAERFVDVQNLCLLGMVGTAILGAWTWFGVLAAIWCAAWSAVVATVVNVDGLVSLPVVNRFEDKFRGLFHGFQAFRRRPRYLIATVGVSMLAWLTSMANLWLLFRIFGADVSAVAILGLWPLALFVGMAPVTIGGVGTRDAAFYGLAASVVATGGAESAILAATFGYGLVVVLLPGVVGIPLMVRWMASRA